MWKQILGSTRIEIRSLEYYLYFVKKNILLKFYLIPKENVLRMAAREDNKRHC